MRTSPSRNPGRWHAIRRNADRLSQVLFDVAEAVRIAGVLLLPIMPKSAAEILRRVGETRPVESLRLDAARWSTDGERIIEKGTACGRASRPLTGVAPSGRTEDECSRNRHSRQPAADGRTGGPHAGASGRRSGSQSTTS